METTFVIVLFLLGAIFLFLEIFIPGGILGLIGIIALSAGIFLSVDSIVQGILYICLMLIVLGILIFLSFRFPKTRKLWGRLALNTRQTKSEGYVAPSPIFENLIGREGIAISQLRPAGTADFKGERLDVVTEGGFIPSGSRIKIIAVEGTRVVVRQIADTI